MPFWRKKNSLEDGGGSNGGGASSNGNGEKVNYKARLEHKQYLVRATNSTPNLFPSPDIKFSLLSLVYAYILYTGS